mmetsp:Transcript_34509/g.48161  ORF Transcript_34509/g.48161 Transcript_34509/m.48161 type:complete len:215 (+) Transcript_34509:493-1137(+)
MLTFKRCSIISISDVCTCYQRRFTLCSGTGGGGRGGGGAFLPFAAAPPAFLLFFRLFLLLTIYLIVALPSHPSWSMNAVTRLAPGSSELLLLATTASCCNTSRGCFSNIRAITTTAIYHVLLLWQRQQLFSFLLLLLLLLFLVVLILFLVFVLLGIATTTVIDVTVTISNSSRLGISLFIGYFLCMFSSLSLSLAAPSLATPHVELMPPVLIFP